jgi:heme-degrading monooxygenase HmoA
MYTITWEYRVHPARRADFETNYSAEGPWVELFTKGRGYQSTELLRDVSDPNRYLTIDRWDSREAYLEFSTNFPDEYQALDAECAAFTDHEKRLGDWESAG